MLISIVIPALNEAENIERVVASAARGKNVEVIVVDGGSSDATLERARRGGALVVETPPGRARQMNEGARLSKGAVLLFLHADTLLPPQFEADIFQILHQPGVIAGAFRFQMDAAGWRFRLIEKVTNWRASVLHLPYGDQALFLRRDWFERLGGFSGLGFMEDFELILRLRRRGRIAIASQPVLTSARRHLQQGVWKTVLKNQGAVVAYLLGVSPERIARWYRA